MEMSIFRGLPDQQITRFFRHREFNYTVFQIFQYFEQTLFSCNLRNKIVFDRAVLIQQLGSIRRQSITSDVLSFAGTYTIYRREKPGVTFVTSR